MVKSPGKKCQNFFSVINFFIMILHDFSLPVKHVKIDTYICLMLVLVIPQIETSAVFFFNLGLHVAPDVARIIPK